MLRFLFAAWLLCSTPLFAATTYPLTYRVSFELASGLALIEMGLGNHQGRVLAFDLAMPEQVYSGITGDGQIKRKGDRVEWTPPASGGNLRFKHVVNHKRSNGGYDALMTQSWLIARGDDLFPEAHVRTLGKARSRTELEITVPNGWDVVTPYARLGKTGHRFEVTWKKRRFDRPVGWLIAGKLGSRREEIEGARVSVAGPMGENFRRLDVLAFLSYNLPELGSAFGLLPERLLIVGGPDPMWRGGLSAPNSFYMHVERPLISENGTSPLLHELVHVITRVSAKRGADWLVEGTAEYYSVELIRRSGGMSQARFRKAMRWQANWGKDVTSLVVKRSRGKITARAVALINELDKEIRTATANSRSLDDVMRRLIPLRKVSTAQFIAIAGEVLGRPSKVLDTPLLKAAP